MHCSKLVAVIALFKLSKGRSMPHCSLYTYPCASVKFRPSLSGQTMVSFIVRLEVLDGVLAELVELEETPLVLVKTPPVVLVDTVIGILSDDQAAEDLLDTAVV